MPTTPTRSFFVPMDSWEGEHKSYIQKIEGLHSFQVHRTPNNPAARLKAYNRATKELQSIIAQAVQAGKSLRAQGSSWSLSKVGVTEHELINTKALRIGFTLPASHITSTYARDPSMLRFLECGASIAAINRSLFRDGLSLKASGSNNGQTLAGAVSTGTHGSAFKFGATQEFVVGLHLITGPSKHVYLERASYPVVKERFAEKLGAELIRDDVMFNAALVSFGSFGIIHGMMIEARKLFLLHAYRSFEKYNPALRKAISKLDFSGLALPRPATKMYHFEVFFNPNEGTPPSKAIVLMMFEGKWNDNYEPPDWDDSAGGLGAGALEIMGELVGSIPSPLNKLVKPMLNAQVRDNFAPYEQTGTIKDIFRGEKIRGKTLACGIGVPLSRSLEAVNVAFRTYKQFGAVLPVLFSMRFVKSTEALLGFTKFAPVTCVLEIDAVNTRKTRDFLTTVWTNLEQKGIPFTLHWGKFNTYLTKARVKNMYGAAVDQWIASREEVVESPEVRKVFTNGFLKTTGLAT